MDIFKLLIFYILKFNFCSNAFWMWTNVKKISFGGCILSDKISAGHKKVYPHFEWKRISKNNKIKEVQETK